MASHTHKLFTSFTQAHVRASFAQARNHVDDFWRGQLNRWMTFHDFGWFSHFPGRDWNEYTDVDLPNFTSLGSWFDEIQWIYLVFHGFPMGFPWVFHGFPLGFPSKRSRQTQLLSEAEVASASAVSAGGVQGGQGFMRSSEWVYRLYVSYMILYVHMEIRYTYNIIWYVYAYLIDFYRFLFYTHMRLFIARASTHTHTRRLDIIYLNRYRDTQYFACQVMAYYCHFSG